MNGQIVRVISNLYTVKVDDQLYGCRARGIFRKNNIVPIVGDYVKISVDDNVITEIMPRRNELDRPVVANVDVAFIVTSCKNPMLDLNLLDRMLSVVIFNDIEPIICFTKVDLLNKPQLEMIDNIKKYYELIGIKTVYNDDTNEIKKLIKNKLVVLAGQTGAGKSSLINKLDKNLNIKTDEISKALGRGKHTTRHVELYSISDGFIVDTPGFSALSLDDMNKEQLRDTFIEFGNYECKFRDCMHNKEIGCKVKEALEEKKILQSRYNNYLLFMEELER